MADQNVISMLRKQSQPAQEMSFDQVVEKAAQKEYPNGNWRAVKGALASIDQQNKGRVIRAGNTLLAYLVRGPGQADFVLLNADAPDKAAQNIQQLMQAASKAGFKNLSGTTSNPEVPKMLQSAGVNVVTGMSQHVQAKGAMPAIQMKVAL